jgi:hypothetical protein
MPAPVKDQLLAVLLEPSSPSTGLVVQPPGQCARRHPPQRPWSRSLRTAHALWLHDQQARVSPVEADILRCAVAVADKRSYAAGVEDTIKITTGCLGGIGVLVTHCLDVRPFFVRLLQPLGSIESFLQHQRLMEHAGRPDPPTGRGAVQPLRSCSVLRLVDHLVVGLLGRAGLVGGRRFRPGCPPR